MAAIDKSTRRVIAVITLLILAAWALRGYLPGSERVADPQPSKQNPAALIVVVVLLSAAVAVIAFAIITRMRDRKPGRPAGEPLRRTAGMGRPSWRFTLIALAAVIGWLVLVVSLSNLGGQGSVRQTTSNPSATEAQDPVQPDRAEPSLRSEDPGTDTNVIGYLIPPMLVLMVVVVIGTAVAARRQRLAAMQGPGIVDDLDDVVAAPAAADSLARAAEVGLAAIGDLSREPREAIIACYAAMERELTRVPGAVPQDCDTPSEVLARAVDRRALRPDSATELVELFEEARFSPHVMTEAHRDAAVRVLQRVLAELPSDLSERVR